MKLKKELWTILIAALLIAMLVGCHKQTEEFTEGIELTDPEMVEVKAGTFEMGNTRDDKMSGTDEKPVHEVELTYDYEIGKYEVTNKEFLAFLNGASVPADGILNGNKLMRTDDASAFKYEGCEYSLKSNRREDNPVIFVTWYGAIEYCNWLSEKEGLAKVYDSDGDLIHNETKTNDITQVEGYRLLTEAEWEYAARGGHESTEDYKYAGSDDINEVAWYKGNDSEGIPQEVGKKKPNEIGIYDMSGNVSEWCHDNYGNYPSNKQTNPVEYQIPDTNRVCRGGNWDAASSWSRVASRDEYDPTTNGYSIGFRIAKTGE
ncbi:MAG: formylglycine-generating enzyme family protein [Thermotogota bacterium]